MADWGQIIAGIDGYRNYENNRALDLQNQAQLIQNQANDIRKNEMMTINDIKGQIAALSDNPYAKLNAWDPQARGQQLLNEDKQLKIASKWASSIKNLAPEKRAQGYAQFLRAMPGLGIDVSDMPQAYDEAYINQLADLGIETETRYQNEQQNARQDKQIAATQANLERQIAANREARQDEFNKKLAAFDYENSYRTQAEKDKQAQIDSMIDASTLSPDDKERAKLAYRNITLPGVKTPQERLMEQFTNPDATDEQRAAARQGLMRIAELQKEIKDLAPVNVDAKDKGAIINNLSTAVQKGTMEPQVASTVAKQLTGNDVDFVAPPKTYAAGDVGTMQYLQDLGLSPEQAMERVNKLSKEEKLAYEQAKSDINAASTIKINEASAQNALNNGIILAGINADNAELQAQRDFVREQQLITFKDSLPTPEQKNISAAAKALGVPEKQLYLMSLNKQQAEMDLNKKRGKLVDAQIGQTLANTEKAQKEAEVAGKTPQIQNAEYLQQNPDMADSPAFQRAGTTVNIDNKTEAKEAQDRAAQKVKAENDYRVAVAMRNEALPRIDSIIEDITENPNTVGAFSSWKEEYNKYTGKNPEWQKIRGNVVRKIKTVANDLIAKAKQSGTSGINTVAEINFIVGNVSPDASPETLIGALEALKGETESFTAKTWDYYQSFNNPLQPYTPYQGNTQAGNNATPTDDEAFGGI